MFRTEVDSKQINIIQDVIDAIRMARQHNTPSITIHFSVIDKIAMHPQEGIPILYHDQMNVIAKYIVEIKDTMDEQSERHQQYLEAIVPTIAAIKSTKKNRLISGHREL